MPGKRPAWRTRRSGMGCPPKGQACRRPWRKELDQPGRRMDRQALRAIVNGAVHGDSALVSADQLMAASRRDHPPMSVSAEPPGSQGYLSATASYRRPPGRRRTAIRPGDSPGRMAVPCRDAAHRRTRQRRITQRFPDATPQLCASHAPSYRRYGELRRTAAAAWIAFSWAVSRCPADAASGSR